RDHRRPRHRARLQRAHLDLVRRPQRHGVRTRRRAGPGGRRLADGVRGRCRPAAYLRPAPDSRCPDHRGRHGERVTDGPLIVQSDKPLPLEPTHAPADDCRKAIAPFAELERAPEHVHTYRLTPLGLWNARAAGHDAEQVIDVLLRYSRYPVPHSLLVDIAEILDRYGRLRLEKHPQHGLVLITTDRPVLGGGRGGGTSTRWGG